jgi:glycosyltransferase involved in cell wall biosynthesis
VYDNASGDETFDVVSKISRQDPRLRYHVHDTNIGGGANFIFGLERVHTPFFSLLSDDDLLLPGFYDAAMESLFAHPEAAFFAGSVVCMTDAGRIRYMPMTHWERQGLFAPETGFVNTVGASYLIWTGIVFRTAVFRQSGGLDLACGAAADIEFVARIASRHSFVVYKEPCAICVNHPGSGSMLPKLQNLWPGWQIMMQKISDNAYVTSEAKQEAIRRLSTDLSNIVSSVSLQSTISAHFYLSRRACVVLRKSGHLSRARLFAVVNKAAQRSVVFRYMLGLIAALRRRLQKIFGFRLAFLNIKYAQLAEHLKQ